MPKKNILILLFAMVFGISTIAAAENVNIKADKQTFDGDKTVFEGNVSVDYTNINVKSPKVVVQNNSSGQPETAQFLDGAHAVKKDATSQSEVKANIITLSLLKNKINAEGDANSYVFENRIPIVHISAGMQEFDMEKNLINAVDNVKIKYDKINTISDRAKIKIAEGGKLEKVELFGNVTVNQENNIINANDLLYNPVTNEMVAYGNVKTKTILEDGIPVNVRADFQQYDKSSETIITSGNVVIKYKEYTASGPKAVFMPEKDEPKAPVNTVKSAAKPSALSEQKTVASKSETPVVVSKPSDDVPVAETKSETKAEAIVEAKYESNKGVQASAQNPVKKAQKEQNIKKASQNTPLKAEVKQGAAAPKKSGGPNKIYFVGRSKIVEGERSVEADKIVLTITPQNFTAEGNVRTKFTQVKGMNGMKKEKK